MNQELNHTIVAPASAPGVGAISLIRLSGHDAITICNQVFKGKDLTQVDTHTVHFGTIREGDRIIDEVLVSVFKTPQSFTKENVVEISCHGSDYIVQQIIQVLIQQGARTASPGEFTKRAFLNGQFDLAQAEAIADLISSDSEATHKAALNQMRGGFSLEIKALRDKLVHFASMVELELDFAEEDVEFADRTQLVKLIQEILVVIKALITSFDFGNAIKNGIPTVIAGKPNAGKSTLLNRLLNEEKAIVSDIPGTTRDFIEDELILQGVRFRFIDTAGLRETDDKVEAIGVARTKQKMEEADLILYLFDTALDSLEEVQAEVNHLKTLGIPYQLIGNKIDIGQELPLENEDIVYISASDDRNIDDLQSKILTLVKMDSFQSGSTIVTNTRHYESLLRTRESLDKVIEGINLQVTGDFLAMDIRQALHFLGEITGEITTDDLLENIFSKFCIGK